MKEIFKKIWDLALPYQDKRDDEGHAEFVLQFALKLVEYEKADENIVIPAAILHDIGWSRVPREEAMKIFGNKFSNEDKDKARYAHQEIGVGMAKEILAKVSYESNLIDKIIEIISEHDTRAEFISKNEGAMRDADKLWRFSSVGFFRDAERFNLTPQEYYDKLKNNINMPGFFYSESAKKIAQEELEKRKEEFKDDNLKNN